MKHIKLIIALVTFLSPFVSWSAMRYSPQSYPWDGGDILGVALEPSGSQKLGPATERDKKLHKRLETLINIE